MAHRRQNAVVFPRNAVEVSFRLCVLLALLCNALAPTLTVSASSQSEGQDQGSHIILSAGKNNYRSPVFTHPQPRTGEKINQVEVSESSKNTSDASPAEAQPQIVGCATSGDLLIASGQSCSLNAGSYTFNSLTVQSGGTLVLVGDPTSGTGVVINTTTASVDGNINADGQGYGTTKGPGAGTSTNGAQWSVAGGGGYGGQGGTSNWNYAGGATYGSASNPTDLGSGGGNGGSGLNGIGGAGGGAIRLVVSNAMTLNGTVSANGGNYVNYAYGGGGGGSGGSVWITAGSLSGNGTIQANGGNGISDQGRIAGGGAGGRIAIDVPVANDTFSGTTNAFGGSGQYGGAGTVYWSATDRLLVSNNGNSGAKTTFPSGNYQFAHLDIKGQGVVRIQGTTSSLTLDNGVLDGGDGTGRLEVEGTINAPASFTLAGTMLVILNTLSGPTDITAQTSGGMELYAAAIPNGMYTWNSLTVGSGTTVRMIPYISNSTTYSNDYGVTLQVSTLTVNGTITSDGQGYTATKGPGAGASTNGAQWSSAGGGGYGGQGGTSNWNYAGGATYGSASNPTDLGSGGGNGGSGAAVIGGTGGGAIRLVVSNAMTLNGTITANGLNTGWRYYGAGGGGSGGSVWITAGSLSGTGSIQANGGNGYNDQGNISGGGAGGRIAVYSNSIASTINMTTTGGSSGGGTGAGGTGSVYLSTIDASQSTVQIEPASLAVTDTNGATLTVTLVDINGQPSPNQPVKAAVVGGTGLMINGQAAQINQYVSLGNSDANGLITAKLTTLYTGTRTLAIQAAQETLVQQAVVAFVPGPISPGQSTLSASALQAAADGQTPITLTITALDAYNNPIPDVNVVVNATGNSTVTQPSAPTNAQGQATATVTDATDETVTVSAQIDSVSITQTASLHFQCKLSNGDFTVADQDVCTLTSGSYTYHSLIVQTGGILILQGNPSSDQGVSITTDNLTVQSGGTISADGQGYRGTTGNGGGPGGGIGAIWTGGGGGYGAKGQDGNGAGGPAYGSVTQPIDLGSAGGSGRCGLISTCPGWPGGGAISLNVTNTLSLDGAISANGGAGCARAGGGSGGSILINAGTLTGAGTIHANGGSDNGCGGGSGAGGRVAIYTSNSTYIGAYTASGGTGYETAGAGSVYLDSVDPANSTISITPAQQTADGTSLATVTVTVLNINGYPMPGKTVQLGLTSGDKLYVNNQLVEYNGSITIGNTDANGQVTAALDTVKAGTRTLSASVSSQTLTQQGTVTFVAGPVSADFTGVSVSSHQGVADGSTPIGVTVQALDSYANPIQGATVVLHATGNAVVTQPTSTTDSSGHASGSIADASAETVTVSATINGVDIKQTQNVTFNGAALGASLSATSKVAAGGPIQYTVSVSDTNSVPAQNVTLQVTLPNGVTYSGSGSSVTPTQSGQTLTWDLGTLASNTSTAFAIYAGVDSSVTAGTVLTASAQVTSTSGGTGSATAQSQVVDGNAFSVAFVLPNGQTVTSQSQTVGVGTTAIYTVGVQNTGLLDGQYSLSVQGLDSSAYQLSQNSVSLAPGRTSQVTLTVTFSNCSAAGDHAFTVTAQNQATNVTQTLSASLTLQSGPTLSDFLPTAGSTLGSQSVTIKWTSDVASGGSLAVYPDGQPGNASTFNFSSGTTQFIVVPNLTRNTTYDWTVTANSACGSTTTPPQKFTIGNGIVFLDRVQGVTINRDYNQLVQIGVENQDTAPHTLTAHVNNPYQDLLADFVDAGSTDQTITLQPGQTVQVTLALHAQDAQSKSYQLPLSLTADTGSQTPINDNAILNVGVLFPNDFTIVEDTAAFDALTLGRTYVITNHGLPVTDLSLKAVDPVTGLPARIFLQPSLDHVRLDTGQSIRVVAYPIFTAADMPSPTGLNNTLSKIPESVLSSYSSISLDSVKVISSSLESSSQQQTTGQATIGFNLILSGGGASITTSASTTCPSGKQVMPVQMQNESCNFNASDWFCTNRPDITTPIDIPAWLLNGNINSATLSINFISGSNVLPNSAQVNVNGDRVGGYTDSVLNGVQSYPVSPSVLNQGAGGFTTQNVGIASEHSDQGHYKIATNFNMNLNVTLAGTYVCADSQADGLAALQQAYSCSANGLFNWLNDIYPGSILNGGNDKSTNSAAVDSDCPSATFGGSQGTCGDPINTHTGVFSFTQADLSFPTSAGMIGFQRSYSSGTLGQYTSLLGYGWTDNLAAHLIFPTDPDGMQGFMLFQSPLGNQYLFHIESDGSYMPGPGVLAKLTASGSPTTYTLVTDQQTSFTFDANGKLVSRADAQGHTVLYTYDSNGNVTQVSADGGTHYIQIHYDSQGRVASVTDYADRQVTYGYDSMGDLTSVTDVLGQTWTYVYDSTHHLTQIIDPSGKQTNRTDYDAQGRAYRQYDGDGNVLVTVSYNTDGTTSVYDAFSNAETHAYNSHAVNTNITDRMGNPTSKTYDSNFRPSTITDASGHTSSLTWSADGADLTQVTDANGNKTAIAYDSLNNPTSITDPRNYLTTMTYSGKLLTGTTDALNGTTQYSYTPEGFPASVTDPLGHTTSYTYNSAGQRISMTDALGKNSTYAYDSLGRLTDATDPLGRVTHNDYDAAGHLIKVTRNYDPGRAQNDGNEWNIVTSYQYDAQGRQIVVTDTLGRTTQYSYDSADRLITTTDPDGNVTTNTYNQAGQLTATTDALGHVTRYAYDSDGRLISTTDALGGTTKTAYNPDGTVASTTDVLSRKTTYTYNTTRQVVSITDPNGGVTSYTYDASGNRITQTDPNGNTTHYEYDALNRLIKQTDPLGGVTETFYDAAGNRIQTIDPRGKATTYAYDADNRLIAVTDAAGNVTTYQYDDAGRRTAVIDALGHKTTYTYDELDRTVTVTDPLGHSMTTAYDALGNTLASTDADQNATSYAYDNLNRLTQLIDPAGGRTSYTYDALGHQLTVTDPNTHTTSTSYDVLGRAVTVTDANGHTASRSYDLGGELLSSTDSLGNTTHYTYDSLGRQTSISDPLQDTTSFGYDADGNRTLVTDAKGVATKFEYDADGRLTAVTENYISGGSTDSQTNVRTEYTYDANGNRLTIKDGNGHVTSFTYSDLNQLMREADPLGNTWQYLYDPVGNRVEMADAKGVLTTYDYDAAGHLTAVHYADQTVQFVYDAAGHRTSMNDNMGTTAWNYDTLGRATSITDPFGKTVGYAYDPAGNRTGLTYPTGKTVSYAYDPANLLKQVTDWNNQTTSYSYDANNQLTDISRPNGVTSTYQYDLAGRLLQLQHVSGLSVLSSFQYTYDANGNRTQAVEQMQSGEVGPTVEVTVTDTTGIPLAGKPVYAFDGTTYTGYNQVTDANGQASITLPAGSYHFRVDVDGTQFWSNAQNNCTVGQCANVMITVPQPVLVSVQSTDGTPMSGLTVYAFDGTTYTNYSGTTDANGQVSLRLPQGNYHFRANFNGTEFWDSAQNDCSVPGCTLVNVKVTQPVTVSVVDNLGMPHAGITVYAFDGTTYTNYNGTTDTNGQVTFTLPQGNYHFRADFNGTQFWDGAQNDCSVPGCGQASISITLPLLVTVQDTDGMPMGGVHVYAFNGSTYTNYNGTTDANGHVSLTLPAGSYRFRADLNGTQFWSSTQNDCTIPSCVSDLVTVTKPLTVNVKDTDGTPKAGLPVYAFDGSTYTSHSGITDANGQVVMTLPQGSYRFRTDLNGTQFWSSGSNDCTLPGCSTDQVVVTKPVTVTIQDGSGTPQASIHVYAFNGTAYSNYSGTSDTNGHVIFTLPQGSYRFRADFNGSQYWSSGSNDCTLPGCGTDTVVIALALTPTSSSTPVPTYTSTPAPTSTSTPVPSNTATSAPTGASSPVPTGTATFAPTDSSTPTLVSTPTFTPTFTTQPSLTATAAPSQTSTPETPIPTQGAFNNVPFAGVSSIAYHPLHLPSVDQSGRFSSYQSGRLSPYQQTSSETVSVTVQDTSNTPKSGLKVYAFDGTTYIGYNGTTDTNGQVVFTLPQGNYRFRADLNGTQFWTSAQNDCTVPGCASETITVTLPVTITVKDTDGNAKAGLHVYAFNGSTYTGYNATTDSNGQVNLTLPQGNYRFRADLNGTQFWNGDTNDCAIPGCATQQITVTNPLTVTVQDTDGTAQAGLPVYAFDGTTYTGYNGKTDSSGQVTLTLPQGNYRFRSDLNGTQFWSSDSNDCVLPGCLTSSVIVTKPLVLTVQSQTGQPYPNLSVYAFDGTTYTGYNGMTDDNGHVTFTLPEGLYHFRADYNGVPFWSSGQNDCTLPGCTTATVTLPGGTGQQTTTINYSYDPLNRLTAADYSSGNYYHYAYDPVGNRLTQQTQQATTNYAYDSANRLTSVNNVNYAWDANGNLLSDGANTYTYNAANQLTSFNGQGIHTSFGYDGLGNRLQQTVNGVPTNYTVDINTGLPNVLMDNSDAYIYGFGNLSQINGANTDYFLTDALGSTRQLVNGNDQIMLAESYDPFGNAINSIGNDSSIFGFTGQQTDSYSGLQYLRARYYDPSVALFTSRDTWSGDANNPLSFNRWAYTNDNPINFTDPSGQSPANSGDYPVYCQSMPTKAQYESCVLQFFRLEPSDPNTMGQTVTGDVGCYIGPKAYRAPGYIEGLSFSLSALPAGMKGVEIVYDFATMQNQVFTYTGFGWDSSIGLSDAEYVGKVMGFNESFIRDTQTNKFFEGGSITSDYSGGFHDKIAGLSVGLVFNITGGAMTFNSTTDPVVRGAAVFVGGSVGCSLIPAPSCQGVGIEFGDFILDYSPYTYTRDYAVNGQVDEGRLVNDILMGTDSPLLIIGGIPPGSASSTRSYEAGEAARYVFAYTALHFQEILGW